MSTVTVSGFTIPDWRWGGSTGKLRLYYSKTWTDSAGVVRLQGEPGSKKGFFQEIDLAVAANVATVPSFNTPSTQDALLAEDRNVTVTGVLFDSKDTERAHLFDNWVIPASPSSTNWQALKTLNSAKTLPLAPSKYLDAAAVQALIDAVLGALSIKAVGTATLVDGTVAVTNALTAANSTILVTSRDDNVRGTIRATGITADVGFTLSSSDAGDNGDVGWILI